MFIVMCIASPSLLKHMSRKVNMHQRKGRQGTFSSKTIHLAERDAYEIVCLVLSLPLYA